MTLDNARQQSSDDLLNYEQPSEMGYRRRMYEMLCARNPTINVKKQRVMDQR